MWLSSVNRVNHKPSIFIAIDAFVLSNNAPMCPFATHLSTCTNKNHWFLQRDAFQSWHYHLVPSYLCLCFYLRAISCVLIYPWAFSISINRFVYSMLLVVHSMIWQFSWNLSRTVLYLLNIINEVYFMALFGIDFRVNL